MPSIRLLHDSALAAALRADVEAIIGPVVNLSLPAGRHTLGLGGSTESVDDCPHKYFVWLSQLRY